MPALQAAEGQIQPGMRPERKPGSSPPRHSITGEMCMSTENKDFDLQAYLTKGVEQVVTDAIKATLKDPKESAFMLRFAAASRAASKKRLAAEKQGEHIPSYLIASITSQCNLHCAGCYSRCNHATTDAAPTAQLTTEEWTRIFDEADELGISFVLLAGGEPMLRQDVIEAAGKPHHEHRGRARSNRCAPGRGHL